MTLHEAEAFVGAERCIMKTLTETDLYCEPPEVQPPPKRRQKRDTAHNLPEFIVRVGQGHRAEGAEGRVPMSMRKGARQSGPGSARNSSEPHLSVLSPPLHAGEVRLPGVGAGPCGV